MAKIKLAADYSDYWKRCLRNKVRFMGTGGYPVIDHASQKHFVTSF